MTPTTNQKLIEQFEFMVGIVNAAAKHYGEAVNEAVALGGLARTHADQILAALRASDANEADAKIMKLVRECYKTGFTCSDTFGRFGEDDCGECNACKLSAALASPSSSAGEGGK